MWTVAVAPWARVKFLELLPIQESVARGIDLIGKFEMEKKIQAYFIVNQFLFLPLDPDCPE